MAVKRPPAFVVTGQKYRVNVIPSDQHIVIGREIGFAGAHFGSRNQVEVMQVAETGQGISLHQQLESYLHEVLHAINYKSGIVFLYPDKEDETIVDALGANLLEFIRRNPEAIRYLTQVVE